MIVPLDRIFYQALARFEHVRFYANAVNDVTVPYVTAAIELEDPFLEHSFNGIKMCVLLLLPPCHILIHPHSDTHAHHCVAQTPTMRQHLSVTRVTQSHCHVALAGQNSFNSQPHVEPSFSKS